MRKNGIAFAILVFAALFLICCSCSGRGLYDPSSAEERYVSHRDELQSAADCMHRNPNIRIVMKGNRPDFSDKQFKLVDGFSVFSDEQLSDDEIEDIKTNILPAFADEELESVRRFPQGFAVYASFDYEYSILDNIYLLCKEIERSGKGELIDLSYITDQHDLGDGWYSVRYSS